MRLSNALATLMVLCLAATGCPRSTGPTEPTYDISELDDDAAADEIVDAMCDWSARCGAPSFECMGDSSGAIMCSATIETQTYAECAADAEVDEIAESLTCAELTAAEMELVNDCLNAMERTACLTQEDLDEMVADIEAGVEPPMTGPAECETLEVLFSDCGEDDDPAPRPGPDPEPDSGSGSGGSDE